MDGHRAPPIKTHPQPDWVPRYPISAETYQRMGAAGLFPPDARVELIEGELIAMSPVGGPHVVRVMHLTGFLVRAVGDLALVSVQSSIRLGDLSEPEPDIALVRPPARRYMGGPPPAEDVFLVIEVSSDLLLLIEVADTSLRYDRTIKAELYARHGVPEYWIVDADARLIHVHRDARATGYAVVDEGRPGSTLEPALLPGLRLPVADLLA